jgi:hypothetical protein
LWEYCQDGIGGASIMLGPFYPYDGVDARLQGRILFTDWLKTPRWTGSRFEVVQQSAQNPYQINSLIPPFTRLTGPITAQDPAKQEMLEPIVCDSTMCPNQKNEYTTVGPGWSFGVDNSGGYYMISSGGLFRIVDPSLCNITASTTAPPTAAPPAVSPFPASLEPDLPAQPVLCHDERPTSASLPHVLNVVGARVDASPAFSMSTRTYGGKIAGDTIVTRPGDLLQITVNNQLEAQGDYPGVVNGFKFPNTTNLHVHGLHVSPTGDGDDVSIGIAPGASRTYTYQLPHDHPSGTFW